MRMETWIKKRNEYLKGKPKQFPVDYTPNLECPSCLQFKVHSMRDWSIYHPSAGKGIDIRNNKEKQKDTK